MSRVLVERICSISGMALCFFLFVGLLNGSSKCLSESSISIELILMGSTTSISKICTFSSRTLDLPSQPICINYCFSLSCFISTSSLCEGSSMFLWKSSTLLLTNSTKCSLVDFPVLWRNNTLSKWIYLLIFWCKESTFCFNYFTFKRSI